MTPKQRAALADAKDRHYLVTAWHNVALMNDYHAWCGNQLWHPYIRVTPKGQKLGASLVVDIGTVRDERRWYVVKATDEIEREALAWVRQRVVDSGWWRPGGWIGIGGDYWCVNGIPLDLAEHCARHFWAMLNKPECYVLIWERDP